jgi:hypothetical protein
MRIPGRNQVQTHGYPEGDLVLHEDYHWSRSFSVFLIYDSLGIIPADFERP